MSCDRARQIDIEDFIRDGKAEAFDTFRAHYPDCADCSRQVEDWTRFDFMLHEILAGDGTGVRDHPDPIRLEAFVSAPHSGATEGPEAVAIRGHLSICETCRSEVVALERFESVLSRAGIREVAPTLDPAAPPLVQRRVEGVRNFLETLSAAFGLGRLAAPAFAMAAVAIFGVWWSGMLGDSDSISGRVDSSELARQPSEGEAAAGRRGLGTVESATGETGVPPLLAESRPIEGLSGETTTLPNIPEDVPNGPQLAEAKPTTPLTEPVVAPTKSKPAEVELPRAASPESESEILLASLASMPQSSYARPPGADRLEWISEFGLVRSRQDETRVETRAPADHAGLTLSRSPRLWWYARSATSDPVEFTLIASDGFEPMLTLDLKAPQSAGLHLVDLAKHGVVLEPDVEYRWFVSLLVDPDQSDKNPVSAGALRVLSSSDPRHSTMNRRDDAGLGHALAEAGIWYDAYDFFARLSRAHPGVEALERNRDQLYEQTKPGP